MPFHRATTPGREGFLYLVVSILLGCAALSATTGQALAAPVSGTASPASDRAGDRSVDRPSEVLANQVTWIASSVGSHTVRVDVRRQPILVLEAINSYIRTRNVLSLLIEVRGTADESEFEAWELYSDDNGNGMIDDTEAPLAVAAPLHGQVRFDGLSFALESSVQRRLMVAYSTALGRARDGSTIDAAVAEAKSFTYDLLTSTVGDFELNSPGEDVLDGCVSQQVESFPVVSRALGGGEDDVLTLDLLLPSNGWEEDILTALEVEIVPGAESAILGEDLDAIQLWSEGAAGTTMGTFDVTRDTLLATVLPGAPRVRFEGLALRIPARGRRVFVTVDVAATPTEGRSLEMLLPSNGIDVASGNDGPLDQAVAGTALHRFSGSELLSSISTATSRVSVGQPLEVRILVQNRAGTVHPDVVLHGIDVVPPRPGSLVYGPEPVSLSIDPGAVDTMTCRFVFDTPGTVHFEAVVGVPDSSLLAPSSTSSPVFVENVPSAVVLAPVSNVTGTLYAGQPGVVPLVWRLSHADTDSLTAGIAVRQLGFQVEDGVGAPQSAAAAFSRLELRAGTQPLVTYVTIPDTSSIHLTLDPPLLLQPGELRDVSLVATIATDSAATAFRLRLQDATCVVAEDASTGAPVALSASLPWSTPLVTIRSIAARLDVTVDASLPGSVNRGQRDVILGHLGLSVPGVPGASEARLTQIALTFRTPDGTSCDYGCILDRVMVTSGATVLLETTSFDTTGGRLVLPLTIPKTVASGALETVALAFDLLEDATLDTVEVSVRLASDLQAVDAISGVGIPIEPVPPDSFPALFGTTIVQVPASAAHVISISRAPTTVAVGTQGMPAIDLQLNHLGAPGTAAIDVAGLMIRTVDAAGLPIVPGGVLDAVRLLSNGSLVAASVSPPNSGSTLLLQPALPPRFAAGDSLRMRLEVDLSNPSDSEWLRFVIDAGALTLVDANEPARIVAPSGAIPFATNVVQIVSPASTVAVGVTGDPPTNAPRDGRDVRLCVIRLVHPGIAGQSSLELRSASIRLCDAGGAPIDASGIATGARLQIGPQTEEAIFAEDSLKIVLGSSVSLAPGEAQELVLLADIASAPVVDDVRLAIDSGSLVATAGAGALAVQPVSGFTLPYVSPSIHLGAASLEGSFANYPNPFAAGREQTSITFQLAADARVTVDIYALSGERVVRLLDALPLPAGLHDELRWDGRNGDGEIVRNGTYLLRLVVDGPGGGKLLRKLAVLR